MYRFLTQMDLCQRFSRLRTLPCRSVPDEPLVLECRLTHNQVDTPGVTQLSQGAQDAQPSLVTPFEAMLQVADTKGEKCSRVRLEGIDTTAPARRRSVATRSQKKTLRDRSGVIIFIGVDRSDFFPEYRNKND